MMDLQGNRVSFTPDVQICPEAMTDTRGALENIEYDSVGRTTRLDY